MAAPQIAVVRNKSDRPVSIVTEGRQVIISPNGEEPMEAGIAQKFLIHHHDSVELVSDTSLTEDAPVAKPREFWIANATGNPDAPETIVDMVYDNEKKLRVPKTYPNPYFRPCKIQLNMHGGEVYFKGNDGGDDSYYNPPYRADVNAFTARKVPENIYNWALSRAAGSAVQGHQELVGCEPFPDFLPKASWGIDPLRTYIQLLDPSILAMEQDARKKLLGPTVAQTLQKAKLKGGNIEMDAAIFASKACNDLMKHIFFRLINPRYTRPTEEEFKSFGGRVAQADAADAAADAVVTKNEK